MNNKVVRWFSLIVGILILVCGISLIFTPLEAYFMISIFVPFSILFHGISSIANYFRSKKESQVSGWMLADGILGTILGVWLMFRPGVAAASLPFIFGFWVLFAGVLRIMGAFTAKDSLKGWGWFLAWGIIGVISGLILLNHPLLSGAIIAYSVAWCFIFMGIQNIICFFEQK